MHDTNLCFKELISNPSMWRTNWKLKGWKEGDEEISFYSYLGEVNSGFSGSSNDN